jgi:hypothetical protein
MAIKKYNVLTPVIQAGVIVHSGVIELDDEHGNELVDAEVLEVVSSGRKREDVDKAGE